MTMLFATSPSPAQVRSIRACLSMAWVSAIRKSRLAVGPGSSYDEDNPYYVPDTPPDWARAVTIGAGTGTR